MDDLESRSRSSLENEGADTISAGKHDSPASSATFSEYCWEAWAEKGLKDSRLAVGSLDQPRMACEFEKPAFAVADNAAIAESKESANDDLMPERSLEWFKKKNCSDHDESNLKSWTIT